MGDPLCGRCGHPLVSHGAKGFGACRGVCHEWERVRPCTCPRYMRGAKREDVAKRPHMCLSDSALVAAFESACVRLCEMDVRSEVDALRAELLARLDPWRVAKALRAETDDG